MSVTLINQLVVKGEERDTTMVVTRDTLTLKLCRDQVRRMEIEAKVDIGSRTLADLILQADELAGLLVTVTGGATLKFSTSLAEMKVGRRLGVRIGPVEMTTEAEDYEAIMSWARENSSGFRPCALCGDVATRRYELAGPEAEQMFTCSQHMPEQPWNSAHPLN